MHNGRPRRIEGLHREEARERLSSIPPFLQPYLSANGIEKHPLKAIMESRRWLRQPPAAACRPSGNGIAAGTANSSGSVAPQDQDAFHEVCG